MSSSSSSSEACSGQSSIGTAVQRVDLARRLDGTVVARHRAPLLFAIGAVELGLRIGSAAEIQRLLHARGTVLRLDLRLEHLLELLERGQVLQAVEPEANQELARGAVEERLPHHLLAPGDADQAVIEQRLEHARGRDAAQLLDLGPGDRLAIGDDGERLERRHRQLGAAGDLEELAQVALERGPRHQAHAARREVRDQALRRAARIARDHRLQRRLDRLALVVGEQRVQPLGRHRLGGDEQDRLDSRFELLARGHRWIASRSSGASSRVVR